MEASKEPTSRHADADGADQRRIAALEAVNRDLLARLAAADQHQRDNGCRFEAATSECQRAEQELERSRVRLRALASELTLAEARERRRLASALHDEVGQGLALSRMKLGLLGHLLTTDEARGVLSELRDLFSRMSQRIRTLYGRGAVPQAGQLRLLQHR